MRRNRREYEPMFSMDYAEFGRGIKGGARNAKAAGVVLGRTAQALGSGTIMAYRAGSSAIASFKKKQEQKKQIDALRRKGFEPY